MVFTVICIVAGLLLTGAFVRGWQSQQAPELLGLLEGHLQVCPDKPNCVSSEAQADDIQHVIAALKSTDWQKLRQAVRQTGGIIVSDDGHYLHATFTSGVFRFVDDVEVRLDNVSGLIHIRSASRIGHSDFGVNRKRVETLRKMLTP